MAHRCDRCWFCRNGMWLRWHAFICDPNKPISNSKKKLLFCAYLIMFMHPNGTNGKTEKTENSIKVRWAQSTEHLTHAGSERERGVKHFARNSLSLNMFYSIQKYDCRLPWWKSRTMLCSTVARPLPMCSPSCRSISPHSSATSKMFDIYCRVPSAHISAFFSFKLRCLCTRRVGHSDRLSLY